MEGQRTGVMHVKARLTETEQELQTATKRYERAEKDAATLAAYIQGRVGTSVWAHTDVMLLVQFLHMSILRNLRQRSMQAAGTGTPASHVLYRRMIEATFKEAVDAFVQDYPDQAQNTELLKDDMLAQLEQMLTDKGGLD